jgi:hypothetical protein
MIISDFTLSSQPPQGGGAGSGRGSSNDCSNCGTCQSCRARAANERINSEPRKW